MSMFYSIPQLEGFVPLELVTFCAGQPLNPDVVLGLTQRDLMLDSLNHVVSPGFGIIQGLIGFA